MIALVVLLVQLATCSGKLNLFSEAVKNYGFHSQPLSSGSHVIQQENNDLHVFASSSTNEVLHRISPAEDPLQRSRSLQSYENQWLAWYFKTYLGAAANGFTLFSSKFVVPPIPEKESNIAIFNSLQASYDPTSYNYILQPVLSIGSWMLGSDYNHWLLSSVMCPAKGSCLFTKPIQTAPGNVILGTIEQLQGSTNYYKFRVNITDITAKSETQSLEFSTQYFAPVALVSLEHNPAGPIHSCDELPAAKSLDFTENVLEPMSMDMWQGSQSDNACGLRVDTFAYTDSKLSIMY